MTVKRVDRRTFLRESVQLAAGLVAGSRAVVGGTRTAESAIPEPCPPSAWKKHGVVLEPTEPWEGDHVQNFTSPAEPLDGDRWRIWYSVVDSQKGFTLAYAEGTPGGSMKKVPVTCAPGEPGDGPFALGGLPDSWRPLSVIPVRLRDGRRRIYFWAYGPGVLRYLAAESDDGRRYRVIDPQRPVLYHPSDRAAHGIASPDGVMLVEERSKDRPADEPLAPPHRITNDATSIYQLADGSFELYAVGLVPVGKDDPAYVAHDNAAGLVRVIDRFVSEDGLVFEGRTRVIQRDRDDPADQQFYHLAVTYTPRGRVGLLGHYRAAAQTMDLEWCFSADGVKWHRPHRSPWLPRGDWTQPDSYGIYAGSGIVPRDGRYHFFYTGVNSSHNGREAYGRARTVVLYATTDSIWATGGRHAG